MTRQQDIDLAISYLEDGAIYTAIEILNNIKNKNGYK